MRVDEVGGQRVAHHHGVGGTHAPTALLVVDELHVLAVAKGDGGGLTDEHIAHAAHVGGIAGGRDGLRRRRIPRDDLVADQREV